MFPSIWVSKSFWPEESVRLLKCRFYKYLLDYSIWTFREEGNCQPASKTGQPTHQARWNVGFSVLFLLLSDKILKILKFAPKMTPKRARPALFPRIPPFWLKKPEPCPNCMVHRQGPALLQTPVAAVPKGALLKKLAQLIGHYKAVAPAAGPAAAWSASWTCAGGAVRRLCSGSAEWSAWQQWINMVS